MIDRLLTAAGIVHRETRFLKPPTGTYAVWMDDLTTDGPDNINAILTHDYTIELYEPQPDPAAEAAIEGVLDGAGLRWTKQARYWLQTEQLYQIVYEFSVIEKRRTS